MSAESSDVPAPPARDDAPAFREPWEAHAFAIAVTLQQRGAFTWPEWTDALAAEIASAKHRGDADLGDTYYRHWLRALESLVSRKGISSGAELARYRDAWDHAADRTPHGRPIALQPSDFASR